jgi:hypothetical protein
VEVPYLKVEISTYNTSTKRSSNLAPVDKISKSGDNGGSGDIFRTKLMVTQLLLIINGGV